MYLDPAFAGMLVQVGLGIALVAGVVWFSIKRKARQILKKDEPVKKVEKDDNNGEIVDTLGDE